MSTFLDDLIPPTERFKLGNAIVASAESGTMGIAEMQHVIDGLTKLVHAKAEQTSAKNQRIARMHAAQHDPKMRDIITRTNAELKRLGFEDINDFAKNGRLHKLDQAMSAANMDTEARMTLKNATYALGLID